MVSLRDIADEGSVLTQVFIRAKTGKRNVAKVAIFLKLLSKMIIVISTTFVGQSSHIFMV